MPFFRRSKRPQSVQPPAPIEPLVPKRVGVEKAPAELSVASGQTDGEAQEAPRPRRRRPGPAKTRLVGFDTSDGRVLDLFDEGGAEKAQNGRCNSPVGWLLVIKGPGKGECFALMTGMSQIGRGEDQAVSLDFGDQAISRSNHAAIVYDAKTHTFLLGHGGKANIVRLNGTPVVSTNDLNDGDTIEIGDTTMLFKALCSKEFNWVDLDNQGDDDDVAIA